jgi:uncharacterized metal-binding protein YceD (DUF177 family)
MTQAASPTFPIARPVMVERAAARRDPVRVEASAEELRALAELLEIPALHSLVGEFSVSGNNRRAKVAGTVTGRVTRTCVVTLEDFESEVSEEVDLIFEEARDAATPEEMERREIDPPDEIIDGKIDLGAVTAEFLALGLDPYPRKPGVAFEPPQEGAEQDSPFAALAKLRRRD